MQPERNFNQQGEETYPERVMGRAGRNGRKWFSFDMPVDPAHPLVLLVTYHGGERRRAPRFDILVDGRKIGTQEIAASRQPLTSRISVLWLISRPSIRALQLQ